MDKLITQMPDENDTKMLTEAEEPDNKGYIKSEDIVLNDDNQLLNAIDAEDIADIVFS